MNYGYLYRRHSQVMVSQPVYTYIINFPRWICIGFEKMNDGWHLHQWVDTVFDSKLTSPTHLPKLCKFFGWWMMMQHGFEKMNDEWWYELTIWSTLSTPTDKNASWSPARSSRPSPGLIHTNFSDITIYGIWYIINMMDETLPWIIVTYQLFIHHHIINTSVIKSFWQSFSLFSPLKIFFCKQNWSGWMLTSQPGQHRAELVFCLFKERFIYLLTITWCGTDCCYPNATKLNLHLSRNTSCAFWFCPATWYLWSSPILSLPLRELGPFLSWKNRE